MINPKRKTEVMTSSIKRKNKDNGNEAEPDYQKGFPCIGKSRESSFKAFFWFRTLWNLEIRFSKSHFTVIHLPFAHMASHWFLFDLTDLCMRISLSLRKTSCTSRDCGQDFWMTVGNRSPIFRSHSSFPHFSRGISMWSRSSGNFIFFNEKKGKILFFLLIK